MTHKLDGRKQPTANKKKRNVENTPLRVLRVRKGASVKKIYEAARRAFTAAELQRFTEVEEGIPAGLVLADLEVFDREETQKRKGRQKHARSR